MNSENQKLRDTFAAAALTGLLAQGDDGSFSEESYARAAYRWADAMLRERGNHPANPDSSTNHDAAPAAKARTDADRNRTDKAAIRPGEGTGDSTGPVAWALVYPNDEVAVIAFRRQDAAERASASDRIVPLYRQPQLTLTDAEREAVEWYASYGKGNHSDILRGLLDRLK